MCIHAEDIQVLWTPLNKFATGTSPSRQLRHPKTHTITSPTLGRKKIEIFNLLIRLVGQSALVLLS
jgi:hypothetical protein